MYTKYLMSLFFFFNDTATTEIYTLSLHDALPISARAGLQPEAGSGDPRPWTAAGGDAGLRGIALGVQAVHNGSDTIDRKSTRLNSSHANISYAVFCLKKKKDKSHNSDSTSFSCNI